MLRALCYAALLTPLMAEPPEMAEGLTPAQAVERMKAPEGFRVDLIAGEPEVVQPIALCFDRRGRLWVAEGLTYPTRAPEGQGQDRILILEDTDGDGTYDSRKVFAEGLNLVSGLEVGFGGVFVGAAPYLLFIPDANGDDKPDGAPQVLLDGWGYQDTHETLNSFIWGPDGWLWGCHGVFTFSKVGKPGTPEDARVAINAGVWRYQPVTHTFEVVAHGTSNPWGLDFNDWGDAFVEACVISHLWNIIPGGYYERQAGSHDNPHIYEPLRTIADHRHWTGDIRDHAHWGHEDAISQQVSDAGGGHAHSGFAICLSDAFPADYRNSAMFFNIHGHRMNNDRLVRGGSGWIGKHSPDLLMTYDSWFLGLSLKSAPGGDYFFCDWQDKTSCHRTDSLRWDRSNGRVYRFGYGARQNWRGDLGKWSDLELAQTQGGRDEWLLRMARKTLQERGAGGREIAADALKELQRLATSHADPTRRLRALWSLAACGELDRGTWTHALHEDEPAVRAWAVRLSTDTPSLNADSKKEVIALAAKEESPAVQLALCSAMQRASSADALGLAAVLAPRLSPQDANLVPMLWFGMERLVAGERERCWEVALSSPDPRLIRWTARTLEGNRAIPLILGALGGFPDRQTPILEGLRDRLATHPEEKLGAKALEQLSASVDAGNALAIELSASAGSAKAIDLLWRTVTDAGADPGKRRAALKILTARKDESEAGKWSALLADPQLRIDAIEARPVLLDSPEVAAMVPRIDAPAKIRLVRLALRENRTLQALGWIRDGAVSKEEVPADIAAALREQKDAKVKELAEAIWGGPVVAGDHKAEIARWTEKLTPVVLAKADLKKGRARFDLTCAACHKLFGQGGEVGPELTGGERASLSHWLDNVLDPNALIGQGYELYELVKKDGSPVVGMLASTNDREVVLKMIGVETRVPVGEVKELKSMKRSMMPEGLFGGLSDDEVRDLIGYLMSPVQIDR